jgi:hypothetical protein
VSSATQATSQGVELLTETRERVADWECDDEVRGILLVGSKSLGFDDRFSDDDLYVILTEPAFRRRLRARPYVWLAQSGSALPPVIYDVAYTSARTLGARQASPRDSDHWEFERARMLLDRGSLAQIVDRLASMPEQFRRARLRHGVLDADFAQRRASKTWRRRGATFVTNLLASRAAEALLRVVFALEWRWVPLEHWLEPELASLADPAGVSHLLAEALATGDRRPVAQAIERLEPVLDFEGVRRGGDPALRTSLLHPDAAAERRIHGLW